MSTPARIVVIFALSAAWAGLLVGVSFVATPVKFLAPSLSLPVALDVGRQTFWALNLIEIVCAASLLVLIFWGFRTILATGIGALLAIAVASQTLWLIPLLDARVSIIMAGQLPPPSPLHTIYVALEGLKVVLLFVLPVASGRTLMQPSLRTSS